MLELLAALTFVDYKNLAMVVQVEAHPNSADEYCVAASVLNRVLSDKFPDTISEVVFAPGQYQGFDFKSYIVPDPRLINKLSSPAGNKSIAHWSRVLNGRTDFKGQSMLGYRVPSEDPMCHPKGNFYHYHWQ